MRRIGWAALAALLALRAAFLWRLFVRVADGFYFYSGDYPTRVVMAWRWAQHPTAMLDGIWLPFGFYLTGAVLKVWPDTLAAPAYFHVAASSALLAGVFVLARELLDGDDLAGLLAAGLFLFDPMLCKLSLSGGASELDFQLFLVGAAVFWARWRRSRRDADLAWMAALLALAGGTRHEAWCFMALPCLELAWRSRASRGRVLFAAALLAAMWLAPALWWRAHLAKGLYPLVPAARVSANAWSGIATPDGQLWTWPRALGMYFAELWRDSPLLVGLAALGLLSGAAGREGARLALYVAASAALMGLASVLARELPFPLERLIVPIRLLLAPLAAGALLLPRRLSARRAELAAAAIISVAAALLFCQLRAAERTAATLVRSRPGQEDVNRTAIGLARLRRERPEARALWQVQVEAPLDEPNRLWAHNVARYADPALVTDREDTVPTLRTSAGWKLDDRAPGLLDLPSERVRENLESLSIGVAIAHTPRAEAKLARIMEPAARVGQYEVFVARGRPDLSDAARRAFGQNSTIEEVRR